MAWKRYGGNKYGSRKVEVDGIVFDSKKEAKRWSELLLLEKAGAIRNLRRQVKFVLIPSQYENITKFDKKKKEIVEKKGKCLERECAYIADFFYWDVENEKEVVEDTKGFRTKDYVIKRKLMLHVHGIIVKEI